MVIIDEDYDEESKYNIKSWQDVETSNSYENCSENVVEGKNNSKTALLIILKLILTPILTFLLWFIYLFIIAMFIPAEVEITETQTLVSLILGFITSIIIIKKIKPKSKNKE